MDMNFANPLLWLLFLAAWPVLPLTVPFTAMALAQQPAGAAAGCCWGDGPCPDALLTRTDLAQLLVAGLASTPIALMAILPARPAARRA